MKCNRCGKECLVGEYGEATGQCFDCYADLDREAMDRDGKIMLYLTHDPLRRIAIHPVTRDSGHYAIGQVVEGKVSNWPGTLAFPCRVKVGKHNMARYRYDVWFTDHNGNPWHGVQIGENTQICHCHKLKITHKSI